MKYPVLLVLFFSCWLASCGNDDDTPLRPLAYNMGTTLSPRGNLANATTEDYVDFYRSNSHGRIKSIHLAWRDDLASSGDIPAVARAFMTQQANFRFIATVGFGWSDGNGNPQDGAANDFLSSTSEPANNTWSNTETRANFKKMVTDFAETYKPAYLFLGNETNAYYVTHTQTEWDNWISEFEECYDSIKTVSPKTIVYTTFQLEKLKGLGIKTGTTYPEQSAILQDHLASGKIDAFGFTSYPYLQYDAPADIPDTYYSSLLADVGDKKVIYSELGWIATTVAAYQGSEALQADFIDRFFLLNEATIASGQFEAAIWLFLYDYTDYTGIEAFTDVGLRNNSGNIIRAADARWQEFAQHR